MVELFFPDISRSLIIGHSREKMQNAEQSILSLSLKNINKHLDFPSSFILTHYSPLFSFRDHPSVNSMAISFKFFMEENTLKNLIVIVLGNFAMPRLQTSKVNNFAKDGLLIGGGGWRRMPPNYKLPRYGQSLEHLKDEEIDGLGCRRRRLEVRELKSCSSWMSILTTPIFSFLI